MDNRVANLTSIFTRKSVFPQKILNSNTLLELMTDITRLHKLKIFSKFSGMSTEFLGKKGDQYRNPAWECILWNFSLPVLLFVTSYDMWKFIRTFRWPCICLSMPLVIIIVLELNNSQIIFIQVKMFKIKIIEIIILKTNPFNLVNSTGNVHAL